MLVNQPKCKPLNTLFTRKLIGTSLQNRYYVNHFMKVKSDERRKENGK